MPAGLEVAQSSSTAVVAQLPSADLLYEGLDVGHLVARVDLMGMDEGFHTMSLG